jgi:transposase
MRIEVYKQREIVRLLRTTTNVSARAIGRGVGVALATVLQVRDRLQGNSQTWDELSKLDQAEFLSILADRKPSATKPKKARPDYDSWNDALERDGDLMIYTLWDEWKKDHPSGISYGQATRELAQRRKDTKTWMHISYAPGEVLFVDFSGRRAKIYPDGQTEQLVEIFVAVLGCSHYMFACAVPSQTIPDWITANRRALEYFGGSSEIVTPDNLKAAVTRNTSKFIWLNATFAGFCEHYSMALVPARPRKPKDKALVEYGVRLVRRWVLAALRDRRFKSIAELNAAIRERIDVINDRPMRSYKLSRRERFLRQEADALTPLPTEPYVHLERRTNVRVRGDYLILYDGHFYSVPFHFAHRLVDVHATEHSVTIFLDGERIASHPRCDDKQKPSIDSAHMPPGDRIYSEGTRDQLESWAAGAGPSLARFVAFQLNDRGNLANGLRACAAVRRLAREHGDKRLDSICCYALRIGSPTLQSVRNILKHNSDQQPPPRQSTATIDDHQNLRGDAYFTPSREEVRP